MYDLRHSQNPFTSSTSSSTPWLNRHQKRSHTLTPTPSSLFSPVSMINLLHLRQSKASSFFLLSSDFSHLPQLPLSKFFLIHPPRPHNPLSFHPLTVIAMYYTVSNPLFSPAHCHCYDFITHSFHPLTVIPMYYTVSIKHHANSAKLSFPHARTNFDNFWQRAFSKHSS